MKAFLIYITEVNICLAALAVAYHAALRRTPRFVLNRIVILAGIAGAFALPAAPVPAISFSGGASSSALFLNLPQIIVADSGDAVSDGFPTGAVFWLFAIYLAGAVGFGLYFLRSFVLTIHKCRNAVPAEGGIRVAVLPENTQAASFFHILFLPRALRSENAALIRAHEMVHIREWHTADLLVTEILKVMCWFNPAAHYLRRAAEINNEFRADLVAAETASDKRTYGQVLIAEALGVNHSLLAHQFLKPEILKTRVAMLTRKAHRKNALNYLALIPAAAFVIFVHGCTEHEAEMPDEQEKTQRVNSNTDIEMIEDAVSIPQKGNDGIYTVVETMPEFPGGFPALMVFLGEEMKYPEGAKADGAEGTVFVSFVIDEEGLTKDPKVLNAAETDERLAAEALRTVGMMPAWAPGEQAGEKVAVKYNLPVRFQLSE